MSRFLKFLVGAILLGTAISLTPTPAQAGDWGFSINVAPRGGYYYRPRAYYYSDYDYGYGYAPRSYGYGSYYSRPSVGFSYYGGGWGHHHHRHHHHGHHHGHHGHSW